MNPKRVYVKVVLLCLPLLLMIGSCKKKRAFNEENGQAAEDIRSVQGQNDEVLADVNIAIIEQSLLRGRSSSGAEVSISGTELCGVDVDTLRVYQGIIRLRYNGISCNSTRKTGEIIISIMEYPIKKWKHSGSTLRIDFVEFKVMHSNGKSVQFDGTAYMVNESGGTWYEMRYLNASNLVQTHTANNLKVTLDGNNTAIFNFNRRLTFNYTNTVTICTMEGLGSSDGLNNLDNWGQNRDGNNFTTKVISPVVWKSTCGGNSPVEGEVSIAVENKDFEMNCLFGVNKDGEVVSDNTNCPYGWKASWSYKKKTNKRVFAYN